MEPHNRVNQEGNSESPIPNLRAPSNDAPITIESVRDVVVHHLRHAFSELDQGETSVVPWASLPHDYRTLIANIVHVKPGLPTPTSAPPVLFSCVEPDPNAIPFLRSLLEGEPGRWGTYSEYPSPLQACHIATALLSGGTRSRISALFLLAMISLDDSVPGSAEAHTYAHSIFSTAMRFGSATDKQTAQMCLSLLAKNGSDSWHKLLSHAASAPTNPTGRKHLVEALLGEGHSHTFSALLGVALSQQCEPELSARVLDSLICKHLPGTPALTMFLEKIASSEDVEQKVGYGRLLSGIDGFTGDYWGRLAPWTFERPLHLLATRGLDPLTVREQLCPHIGHSIFLAAYSVTEGHPILLRHLDALFAPKASLTDAENTWLTTQLRQSLIRASLLTPRERTSAFTNIFLLSQDSSNLILNITRLCDLLSASSVKQRLEFPALEAMRFIASTDELDACPSFVTRLLPEASTPEDQLHRDAFLAIDPSLPPHTQLADLFDTSPGTLDWLEDTSTQLKLLGSDVAAPSTPFSAPRCGTTPVHEFVRAQTINQPNTALLRLLGEALSLVGTSTDQPMPFSRWRYDQRHPTIARQLRSLSPEAIQSWSRDLSALVVDEPIGTAVPVDALNGKSQYLVLLTDHPELLFSIGKIPLVTAACTSFNNGAYYSQTVVSTLTDAHIKGVFVFDAYKMLYHIAPQLPGEFAEALQSGKLSQAMVSKYFYALLPAIEARSVVKLVETPDQKPILMMEPSFIRGSSQKMHSTNETLRFVLSVSDMLGTGVALRSYVDQTEYPLEVVILPPSISPGGQLENHDFAPWLASHHGATAMSATIIKPPPK